MTTTLSKTRTTEKKAIETKKYRISAELAKFSAKGAANKRKEIMEACNIPKGTLSEWENIKANDPRIIGFDPMMKIAKILGCEPSELLNDAI
jgi:transcriptional regulator with XRE-family HTH domain